MTLSTPSCRVNLGEKIGSGVQTWALNMAVESSCLVELLVCQQGANVDRVTRRASALIEDDLEVQLKGNDNVIFSFKVEEDAPRL